VCLAIFEVADIHEHESNVDDFCNEGVVYHAFLRRGQIVTRSAETPERKCQEKKKSVVGKRLLVPPS
jgi:hypothetical protein